MESQLTLVSFLIGSTELLRPVGCPSGALISPVSKLFAADTLVLAVVSSQVPLSMREQSVSLDLRSSVPLLAGLLSVSFFVCF